VTTDQLLEVATERHRAGDLPKARCLYQQVLANAPGHAVALFRFGLLELQDGHAAAALAFIEQAAAACPSDLGYQFGLGEALTALRRWEEAAIAYRRVLHADPYLADAHFALGLALQSAGDYARAITSYQAAARFQPEFADAFNNLGSCHWLLGDLPQAEAAYRQALAFRPHCASVMSNLGMVLQAAGHVDEAVELLRAAVGLEPEAALPAVNLGAALCRQRKFGDAASVLRRTLQRDEKNAEAAYNLGNALHGLGKLREAMEQYGKAIDVRPDYTMPSLTWAISTRNWANSTSPRRRLRPPFAPNRLLCAP
jgi:tetratricopeptide (TPR) repeat protein